MSVHMTVSHQSSLKHKCRKSSCILIFSCLSLSLFLAITRPRSWCLVRCGVSRDIWSQCHNIPRWSRCTVSGGPGWGWHLVTWGRALRSGGHWGAGRGNIDIITWYERRDNHSHKCAAAPGAGVIVCLYADLPGRIFVGITPCTRPRCKSVSGSGGECVHTSHTPTWAKAKFLAFDSHTLQWILFFTQTTSLHLLVCLKHESYFLFELWILN